MIHTKIIYVHIFGSLSLAFSEPLSWGSYVVYHILSVSQNRINSHCYRILHVLSCNITKRAFQKKHKQNTRYRLLLHLVFDDFPTYPDNSQEITGTYFWLFTIQMSYRKCEPGFLEGQTICYTRTNRAFATLMRPTLPLMAIEADEHHLVP